MSAATATNLKLKEDISQRCYEVKNEIKRLGIERTNGGIRNEGKPTRILYLSQDLVDARD